MMLYWAATSYTFMYIISYVDAPVADIQAGRHKEQLWITVTSFIQ